ncbi:30S ribosomal protein S20 [bacterium]|nr:30S ribosomal protein S20 [bacterium]
MANIKSAKKRAKQEVGRRQKNLNRKTAVKSAIKKVVAALESGESKEKTLELLKSAEAKIARAKCKGVFHANTSARKVSRLAKRVAAAQKA